MWFQLEVKKEREVTFPSEMLPLFCFSLTLSVSHTHTHTHTLVEIVYHWSDSAEDLSAKLFNDCLYVWTDTD